jgi:hypothetical protein
MLMSSNFVLVSSEDVAESYLLEDTGFQQPNGSGRDTHAR